MISLKHFYPALVFASTLVGCVPLHASNYGGKIVLPVRQSPGNGSNSLKEAADDAGALLAKITGKLFESSAGTSPVGIQLLLSDDPAAPPDSKTLLQGKGPESFLIRSRDDQKLLLVANDFPGLTQGLYYYLNQLGCRFFLPNDNWTILPKKQDIDLKIDKVIQPDFRVRNFFGTGGFGPLNPIDPKLSIRSRWATWQRRNGFGGEFRLAGHAGEAFNLENKATLLAHPEYLAMIGGKHVEWSQTAKLNAANPEAVKLFVDWSVARFKKLRQTDPNYFAVSVEPSDGGGHSDPSACKNIGSGSPSDQVFYVANQVAKAVAKEFPGGNVSLYAYNEHAEVPTISIEPNVYVTIIPYAFQRTGLSPEEFIAAWGKKVSHMSIYDYWSIPDWTQDLPDFDPMTDSAKKLRYWKQQGIEGFNSESTFSGGAMGLAWYLAGRLMWDVNSDENALAQEFYDLSFGPAQAPMKRMLARWARGFHLIEPELALSYQDVNQAAQLARGNPEILARLADFGRYLEYLRLRREYLNAPKENSSAAKTTLVRHLWNIYDSDMVHAFRLYQLLARNEPGLQASYNARDPQADGWQNVHPMTDAEALERVGQGAQSLQPLPSYEVRTFGSQLAPLPPNVPVPQVSPDTSALWVVGTTEFTFYGTKSSTLPLSICAGHSVRVQLSDASGKLISEQVLSATQQSVLATKEPVWSTIQLPVPATGEFKIRLIQAKNDVMGVKVDTALPLVSRGFRTPKPIPSSRQYFFVPRGLTSLIMNIEPLPKSMQPRLRDAAGNPVQTIVSEAGRLMIATVPPGQDGTVWSIENIVAPNRPLQFINAPMVFAFRPQDLLLPRDAF